MAKDTPSNTIIRFDSENEDHEAVAIFLYSAWSYLDQATHQGLVQIGNDPKVFKSLCVLDDLFEAMFDKPFEMRRGTYEWHLSENDRQLLQQYIDGRRDKAPGALVRQVRKVVDFFKSPDEGGSCREFETAEEYGKFCAEQSQETPSEIEPEEE